MLHSPTPTLLLSFGLVERCPEQDEFSNKIEGLTFPKFQELLTFCKYSLLALILPTAMLQATEPSTQDSNFMTLFIRTEVKLHF